MCLPGTQFWENFKSLQLLRDRRRQELDFVVRYVPSTAPTKPLNPKLRTH